MHMGMLLDSCRDAGRCGGVLLLLLLLLLLLQSVNVLVEFHEFFFHALHIALYGLYLEEEGCQLLPFTVAQ